MLPKHNSPLRSYCVIDSYNFLFTWSTTKNCIFLMLLSFPYNTQPFPSDGFHMLYICKPLEGKGCVLKFCSHEAYFRYEDYILYYFFCINYLYILWCRVQTQTDSQTQIDKYRHTETKRQINHLSG